MVQKLEDAIPQTETTKQKKLSEDHRPCEPTTSYIFKRSHNLDVLRRVYLILLAKSYGQPLGRTEAATKSQSASGSGSIICTSNSRINNATSVGSSSVRRCRPLQE